MTIITIALDSVIPQDMTEIAWAKGYAKFLAAHLDEVFGGEHTVRLGEHTDHPSDAYRVAGNRAYDDWCGMSDAEQAEWID